MNEFNQRSKELISAGQQLYARGMVPATSGNMSARLNNGDLAISVSGRHKGKLTTDDIMRVDKTGRSMDERRPSAETLLHVGIYQRYPNANFVLHPHSIGATLISRLCNTELVLRDYEILKAFPGIDTHDCQVSVPVFDNDQDIPRLAERIDARLTHLGNAPGYLIRGHGFYTWGANLEDALRHVEAFEFLFECELRVHTLQGG